MPSIDASPNALAERVAGLPIALLYPLAEFRYHLRRFLHLSEEAALRAGLQPQQHQLLLQIAGCAPEENPTVAYAAERLGLRHNSTVELVNRCAIAGLLERHPDPADGRSVVLGITAKGRRLLRDLSEFHARELNEMAPQLIHSLQKVRKHAGHSRKRQTKVHP